MFNKWILPISCIVFTFLMLLFSPKNVLTLDEKVKIVNGVLDLRKVDFNKEFSFFIKGDAWFYWREFIDNEDLINSINLTNSINSTELNSKRVNLPIDKSWINEEELLINHPKHGYGTYHFKILLPENFNEKIYLKFYAKSFNAYEVEANGAVVVRNGTLGKDENTSKSFYNEQNIALVPEEGGISVLIRTSEFYFAAYNQGFEIKLSNYRENSFFQNNREIVYALLIGIFSSFSVYMFIFFMIRRGEYYNLWMSILSVVVMVRILISNDRIMVDWITFWLGAENWPLILKFEMFTFIGAILTCSLIYNSFYKDLFHKKIFGFFVSFCLLFLLAVVFFNGNVYEYFLVPFRFVAIFFYAYFVFVMVKTVKFNKRPEDYSLLYILLMFVVLVVHDILIHAEIIENRYDISAFGNFFFILYQSSFTFYKFQKSYNFQKNALSFFEKFVPVDFVSYLTNNKLEDLKLGIAQKLYTSVVFLKFEIVSQKNVKKVKGKNYITALNNFFSKVDKIVSQQGGFIDKYLDNTIMVVFIAKNKLIRLNNVITAAVKINDSITSLNNRSSKYKINLNLGIHAGQTILGTVGAKYRMDGTVIGDNVNIAARLQQLGSRYDLPIVISNEVKNKIKDIGLNHRIIDRGKFILKGKQKPHSLIEVLTTELTPEEEMKISYFKSGLKLYQEKKWEEANFFFKGIKNELGIEEKINQYYIDLCEAKK